jgi:hypothetical protein
MKFSIGDLVSIKKTGEEGIIKAIIDDEMYQVEISGTTFPAYKDEIEHPYLNWFLKQKKSKHTVQDIQLETKSTDKSKKSKDVFSIASGYHLAFQPIYEYDGFEDVVTHLKVFFVNQSPENVYFNYNCKGKINTLLDTQLEVLAYTKQYLHDIPYEMMHHQPDFNWQVIRTYHKRKIEESDTLKIKPKRLYDIIHQLQLEADPSFTIQLCNYANVEEDMTANWDENTDEQLKNMQFDIEPLPTLSVKSKQQFEIDLHIEHLVEDTTDLDNFEMLQIQLDAFENALNTAIQQHFPYLTIIHGVGKGKLRDAIHNILKTKYNIHDYIQNWSPAFGNGATQVIFNH